MTTWTTLKRRVIGRPLATEDEGAQLLPKRLALPVFASDPLSSVAYASEEAMLVLALAGAGALRLLTPVSFAVADAAGGSGDLVPTDDPRLSRRWWSLHRGPSKPGRRARSGCGRRPPHRLRVDRRGFGSSGRGGNHVSRPGAPRMASRAGVGGGGLADPCQPSGDQGVVEDLRTSLPTPSW